MAVAISSGWVIFLLLTMAATTHAVGINWGTLSSHPLHPKTVISMLKNNGWEKIKLFDADPWTVSAFAGTNIDVMVAIPNNMLQQMTTFDNAKDWVKQNVTKHIYQNGVNIKYVAVGNEPFLKTYNGSYLKTTFPALNNVQTALKQAGHENIKATVPLNADVYESKTNKPSNGDFRSDVKNLMHDIVNFLHENGAPFVVNIYPFLSLYDNPDFPIDFAFFEGGDPIKDGDLKYTNVFDANHDTLVSSLKKAGVPDLKIVIGEIGWPTDGDKDGNLEYAKKFYDGLFKKLAKKEGTPLRPGRLDVYLFGLVDENMKSVAPGDFERHWGIFTYDGRVKFEVDLNGGGGEDRMLVSAEGVEYLPAQWCVVSGDLKNKSRISNDVNYACSHSDCTSLGYGSSCNGLSGRENVSYAFNMYFQMKDQDVEACDFDGVAKIVTMNASVGECLFPVQIVTGGGGGWLGLPAVGVRVVGIVFLLFYWL